MPSMTRDSNAKVCSFTTSSTNTVVKARKPGTSRKLCKMPISTPVNAARSTTKLLSKADQVLKPIGIAIDININNVTGLCLKDCDIVAFLETVVKSKHRI